MRKAQQTRSLVAAWFDFLAPGEAPGAQAIHKAIRACAPELAETVRQGNLLMSLNGEPVLAIAPGRGEVQLLVFNGSELEQELGSLEGVARRQRMVRFPSGIAVEATSVARVARASVEFARRHQAHAPG
jgi:hypothetical protein